MARGGFTACPCVRQVTGARKEASSMESEITPLGKLHRIGGRYHLRVKVKSLDEVRSDKMVQKGTLSDGSGDLPFVVWADAGLELLREGRSYLLENVLLKKFQGNLQLQLNR